MKLRLFRNATVKLAIAGKTILIDPFLAPKGTRPSYTGRARRPANESQRDSERS
jgi:L-ascorbate metabolism protein UlaG (beta-lactamase superfamily)